MKRIVIVSFLLLALCFSLAACGGSGKDDPAAAEFSTVEGKLAFYGFSEQDLLPQPQDSIEFDADGDVILHSAASYEVVAKTLYDACKKAAEDGIVRDRTSEEPTDFVFAETMLSFGYRRGGAFASVAISPIWSDQETGITDYLLQWD